MNWYPFIPLLFALVGLFAIHMRTNRQLYIANKALDALILQRNKLRNELDVAQREAEEILTRSLLLAAKAQEVPPGHHKCSP